MLRSEIIICLLACCAAAHVAAQTSKNVRSGTHESIFSNSFSHREEHGFSMDWQMAVGLVLAFVVSALANSAGVGGGAFFVPLFNIAVGFSLKSSTALSQATMAGGAIAGVLYSLFRSNPTKPGLPVVSFRLALELGPPLILGTSLGVMVNPLVPDWLIVILLTVVLLLLASRVTVKAIRMRAAETALLSGRATANLDPSASSAKALAGTPFAAIPESLEEVKVKSFPVTFDHEAMSPAASGGSVTWDLDDELPPSPTTNGGGRNSPGPSELPAEALPSSWGPSTDGPFHSSTDETSFNYLPSEARPPPVLTRFAPGTGSRADNAAPITPAAKRKLKWTVILLEAFLLLAVVAVFLVLQMLKSHYDKCTGHFIVFYAAQAMLCLTVSMAWIAVPAMTSWRGISDAEVPLLSRVESFVVADPAASSLFLAAAVALLGGCLAGLVGLGGGMVLGPLLLELGVHPLVAAATSILLVACSATSAAVEFALEDLLPYTYAGIYFAVCAVGSLLGVAAIGALVRRSGRASYIVFILAGVIATGGMATAASGGIKAIAEFRHGIPGFHNICTS